MLKSKKMFVAEIVFHSSNGLVLRECTVCCCLCGTALSVQWYVVG